MKIPLKAEVAIRTNAGLIGIGLADWADETRIQIRSDMPIEKDETLTLQLGIAGLPGKLEMTVVVLQKRMAGDTPVLVCTRQPMDDKTLKRFQTWLDTVSDGGNMTDALSWMGTGGATPSGEDTQVEERGSSGRAAIQEALHLGIHLRDEDEDEDKDKDDAYEISNFDDDDDDEWEAEPVSMAPRKSGLEIDGPRNNTLTITWNDVPTLQRDLPKILDGAFKIEDQVRAPGGLDLRLVLPDGQKLLMSCVTKPAHNGTWLIFKLGRPVKTKLKRAAR